jgi:hypothetical protein
MNEYFAGHDKYQRDTNHTGDFVDFIPEEIQLVPNLLQSTHDIFFLKVKL